MGKHISAIFADILVDGGIEYVFGMPGGNTIFLFDGLVDRQEEIKTVLARHEGGAAVMADIHARLTGKPALLMGQGPWICSSGAYGIIESYLAGVPMIIVADTSDYFSLPQHGPYQNGTGDHGSYDLINIMKSYTKYTTVANNASEFIHGLQQAIKHSITGRPGPAAVIVRWNVVFQEVDIETLIPKYYPLAGYLKTSPACISGPDAEKIADMLLQAEAPVLIAGHGVKMGKAYEELKTLAELLGIPVATSYMGKSSIPETHDCAVGTMGAIGQAMANQKISGADVILTVGSCLAPENTKWLTAGFINPEQQKIIQIDIEPLNTGWTYPIEMGVTSDAKLALGSIINAIKSKGVNIDVNQRLEILKKEKQEAKCFNEDIIYSDSVPIDPERVVKAVNNIIDVDDLLVLDGGNNRMWFTHHFQSKKAGQLFAGGGAAAVGYGPPAALSAKLTCPDKKVICICGDGGMMMQLYTLEMARELDLDVTFVVLNNSCLGNIRDYQPPGRRIATEYATADFAKIAQGFGVESYHVEKPEQLDETLQKAKNSDKPALVEIIVEAAPHYRLQTG